MKRKSATQEAPAKAQVVVTVQGILEEGERNANEAIVQVSILAEDEREYVVSDPAMVKQLADYCGSAVKVEGVVETEENDLVKFTVKSFEVLGAAEEFYDLVDEDEEEEPEDDEESYDEYTRRFKDEPEPPRHPPRTPNKGAVKKPARPPRRIIKDEWPL